MNQSLTTITIILILLISISLTQLAHAQNDQQQQDYYEEDDPTTSQFKPSIYVVVAVLSFMFSTTFLLLIYAKYCHHPPTAVHSVNNHHDEAMFGPNTRFSGLDKTVVESLPFFRFSSLKGSKQGLHCSVCLAEFEDIEMLRLLPKCNHCFHIRCIDEWLESHSSCPLCRQKISSTLTAATDASSSSILELFVEREDDHGASEKSIGDSFRRIFRLNKEEDLLGSGQKSREQERVLHGFKHQIVLISDIMLKNRWSNITCSDMLFLNSEMLGVMSSNRFSSFEEINVSNSDSSLNFNTDFDDLSKNSLNKGDDRRSMSEITGVSRFKDMNHMKNKLRNCLNEAEISNNYYVKEEIKKRKIWLSIAKRTVEWFVNSEKNRIRSQQQQQSHIV